MTDRLDRIEEGIEDLLGAVATTQAEVTRVTANVDRLVSKADYNDKLFETLRAEAQADREETRRLWNDAVTQMEQDRAEARERADADRAEARERADIDRADSTRRFNAQQEIIQRLLIELVEMNRDNRRLHDRLDGLERAS